jgi:hypothetical protein
MCDLLNHATDSSYELEFNEFKLMFNYHSMMSHNGIIVDAYFDITGSDQVMTLFSFTVCRPVDVIGNTLMHPRTLSLLFKASGCRLKRRVLSSVCLLSAQLSRLRTLCKSSSSLMLMMPSILALSTLRCG